MPNNALSGSIFNTQQNRIEEVINQSVGTFLPSLDPIWRDTIVTSQGVAPASNIGRDMKVLKNFMGGFAGVFEQGGGAGRDDFALYGDAGGQVGDKLLYQAATRTFPNALAGVMPGSFRLGFGMRSMVANLAMTLGEMQAEAMPSFIGEILTPKLNGFGRLIAHTLCNHCYLDQNAYYAICATGSTTLAGAGTGADPWTITFQPSNLAVDRFFVGQRVDLYSSDGATRRNDNSGSRRNLTVLRVNELTGYVTLGTINVALGGESAGTDPSGWSLAATDIVVYANSKGTSSTPYAASPYFTGIAGINSWMKFGSANSSEYLLGDERDTANQISVDKHPEFRSYLKNWAGQPLTEHELRKHLRRFHAAKNKYGQTIDTLIASDGVILAFEATKIGREIIDRTGSRSSLSSQGSNGESLNDSGFTFTFDGRTYKMLTSTYVESGTVYGIKKGGNNWKRYVPPSPKGTKRNDKVESFIPFEFVGSALTGTQSIQIPIFSISGSQNLVTEAVQMPGYLRMQLAPDQPAGLKFTNVAEDRVYSD